MSSRLNSFFAFLLLVCQFSRQQSDLLLESASVDLKNEYDEDEEVLFEASKIEVMFACKQSQFVFEVETPNQTIRMDTKENSFLLVLKMNEKPAIGNYTCTCKEKRKVNKDTEKIVFTLPYRMCDKYERQRILHQEEKCPEGSTKSNFCVVTEKYPEGSMCDVITNCLDHKENQKHKVCHQDGQFDSFCEAMKSIQKSKSSIMPFGEIFGENCSMVDWKNVTPLQPYSQNSSICQVSKRLKNYSSPIDLSLVHVKIISDAEECFICSRENVSGRVPTKVTHNNCVKLQFEMFPKNFVTKTDFVQKSKTVKEDDDGDENTPIIYHNLLVVTQVKVKIISKKECDNSSGYNYLTCSNNKSIGPQFLVTFQWYVNGFPVEPITNDDHSISLVQVKKPGVYTCEITVKCFGLYADEYAEHSESDKFEVPPSCVFLAEPEQIGPSSAGEKESSKTYVYVAAGVASFLFAIAIGTASFFCVRMYVRKRKMKYLTGEDRSSSSSLSYL